MLQGEACNNNLASINTLPKNNNSDNFPKFFYSKLLEFNALESGFSIFKNSLTITWNEATGHYSLRASAQWGLSEFKSDISSVWFWYFNQSRHKNVQ